VPGVYRIDAKVLSLKRLIYFLDPSPVFLRHNAAPECGAVVAIG
jgi:hypothetical protein